MYRTWWVGGVVVGGGFRLSGACGNPDDSEVLLGFLESAFSIGNEGTVVSCGVGVFAHGVSQLVHIGSGGSPVVTSDVVDSESVCNSCDFRMLGKEYPPTYLT